MDRTVPPGAAILLDFIRETEVGRSDRASYDVIYGHNQGKLPQPLTTMTYGEVVDAHKGWSKRFRSSAAGGYQFMRATLIDLAKQVTSISGQDVFTPDLQDRLAYRLLLRRGYAEFIVGKISLVQFAENHAKEWASFPVIAATKGSEREVRRGQSYYAGDGLNKALVKPEKVEAVLKEVLEAAGRPHEPVKEPEARPVPSPALKPKPKPVRKSGRFWTWLLTACGTIVTGLKELNLVALDWRVQIAILVVIVGFAVYAITSMPALRGALGVGWPKILGGVLVLAAITWVIVEIREDGARSAKTAIERQNNDRAAALIRSAMITTLALLLAGCGTSGPGSATALRSIVGTDLIGARGATPADQRKIDRTVVGICAAAVWTKGESARHGEGR